MGSMSEPAAAASRKRVSAHKATTSTTAKPATTSSSTAAPTSTTVGGSTSSTGSTRSTIGSTTTSVAASSGTNSALSQTTPTTAPAAPNSTPSSVLFGAATEESSFTSFANLDALESHAGKKASVYVMYRSFYWDPDFPTAHATAIANRGATPFMTWEPWNPSQGANQPQYALATIARGDYDAMINRWAGQIKAWGRPMYLRFAAEMNGDWFPWSINVNGNTSADYVNAWRHVHGVFAANGVTNVKWVWNVNVPTANSVSYASVYPGDAYVDWVGIDGYNWGTSASWSSWQSPSSVFGSTLSAVRAITSRPIIIGETASAEAGGDKAAWTTDFFSFLKANTDIKAFVWFNLDKETDWRIESSSAAQSAFARGVSDPRVV